MNIQVIDWIIIGVFFLFSLLIGLIMSKKAGQNTSSFFLSGRNLPWYIAGTSMVATTFAADTPLAVTELVADNGIAGNWLWWNMMIGGMLTVFFFARLWRRSGIMTDCEFVSIRYSGKAALFLRGFRAVYIGIFMNVIVIAWVNLAMVKILKVMFPDLTFLGFAGGTFAGIEISPYLLWVAAIMLFIAFYSSLSGLMGTSITDSFQFVVAMTGCIILAVVAVGHPDVGGIAGLKEKLPSVVFDFFPKVGSEGSSTGVLSLSVIALITYLGVQWWASWYPGAEPGGGGYVAQRMMSAKNEKHSLLATLWFQIAHFALRPWPWILVALASLVLYPDLPAEAKGEGFVMVIRDLLPPGLMGLLLAAFFAAYMSTIASQTVWGTSYIVNDLYKPILKPGAGEKYYVRVSRVVTYVLIAFSLIVTSQLDRISDAWKFILECSAGIGLVLILRWFWWRINAWTEISALIAPFIIYPFIRYYEVPFPQSLLVIVAWSTLVWIVVTFLTRPTEKSVLQNFYARVHPGGIGWRPIAKEMTSIKGDTGFLRLFMNWFLGCIFVLFTLFGIGKLVLGEGLTALLFFGIAAVALVLVFYNLSKSGWDKIVN